MSQTGRRDFLKGLAAGALILGFNPLRRSFLTDAAAAQRSDSLTIPPLDGVLTTDPAQLAAAADDFGHIIHRTPYAVLHAGSVDDIVKIVKFARANGIKVAARGQGHCPFGQAQVDAGISVNMGALKRILSVSSDHAVVEAGATWRDLLITTTAQGLTPPVLTGFIGLSVGGTLSLGGIGGASFRDGLQIDNVLALDVVTGEGELLTCSHAVNRTLFEASLAGLGQCGLIVRATLRLVPAPQRVRSYRLFYPDIVSLLTDHRRFVADQRFHEIVGFVQPTPAGFAYFLECGAHYTAPAEPDATALLAGIGTGFVQTEDHSFFDYCDRVTPLIEFLKAAGLYNLPHPWIDLIVPGSQATSFIGGTVQQFTPADLGPGGFVLLFALNPARMHCPLFPVADEEVAFLFDVLRTAPSAEAVAPMLQSNRALYERNRSGGGTFYPISAVAMSQGDWREHFRPNWGLLESAKRRFDPTNILTPGPGIFG